MRFLQFVLFLQPVLSFRAVLFLYVVWSPVFADVSRESQIRLIGEERLQLISASEGGSSDYCVWLERAQPRQRNWQVELLTPDGGMFLRSLESQPFLIPFDLKVQVHPGAAAVQLRPEDIVMKGTELASHCGQEGASFRLNVQPTMDASFIPGGVYRQRLQLRLTADEQPPSLLAVHLVLRVPERVGARVLGSIQLPDFDGRTEPSGEANVCLFRNGGGAYVVRLQGDGEQGQFQLQGKNHLSYRVGWQGGAQPFEWLGAGDLSRMYQGSSFADCRQGYNASVRVAIPVSEARRAASGNYQGRLRIIVQAR